MQILPLSVHMPEEVHLDDRLQWAAAVGTHEVAFKPQKPFVVQIAAAAQSAALVALQREPTFAHLPNSEH